MARLSTDFWPLQWGIVSQQWIPDVATPPSPPLWQAAKKQKKARPSDAQPAIPELEPDLVPDLVMDKAKLGSIHG